MVELSTGGLVGILSTSRLTSWCFLVDFLSVGFNLPVAFDHLDTTCYHNLKSHCPVNDFIISIGDCHCGLVPFKLELQIGIGILGDLGL